MSNQKLKRVPPSSAGFEDSPIEKMVKKAISSVKDTNDHGQNYTNNNEFLRRQAEALRAYETTALFKQLAEPVVKQNVGGSPATPAAATGPIQPVRRETFGHLLNCSSHEVDSNTWKTMLPNAGIESTFSKPSPGRKNLENEKGDSDKPNTKIKKRQYARKPRLEKTVKGKGVKPVKTTSEIIQEFNFSRASQQNGMGNFELGFMNDPEYPETASTNPRNALDFFTMLDLDVADVPDMAVSKQPSWAVSAASDFRSSPDKSSSHSLYPEYSEEIPLQSQTQSQNPILPAVPATNHPFRFQQQEKCSAEYPQSTQRVQVQKTSDSIGGVKPATTYGLNSDCLQNESEATLRELNRKLLREVAILRLFIRSQKARIDTLCKQNEAYRQMVQQNAFHRQLENIDKIFTAEEMDISDLPSVSPVMVWGC